MDYSNCCIYHIRNKISKNVIYVGSTIDFKERKTRHKWNCNNITAREHHKPVYALIRETSFDCYEIIPVTYLSLNNRQELVIEEQTEMDKHSNLLNVRGAVLDIEKRKEKKKIYVANYFVKNREKICKKTREYNIINRDIIKERGKEYREKNKERINEYKKEKITCECGCVIIKNSLQRHMRTKKHLDNIEKV